ncbi:Starch-binding associating with outer membrane [Hymenobacter daecheongensis DSM 21074]|uniref:Starch-binding associating with outer membrane n=1 Tax=Hymenobacter daecheongensis DSM 21074 TaxID=1121955 RepID=A0A1M6ERL6_9BACT|nr:RagB/SusD family nutrient uptake outer membrane protein [Hymenobacter daecheongensis]SHI88144.1 Starch-binding associating with outer membrane [Hymenobacter daecheongensis DSM 21074]
MLNFKRTLGMWALAAALVPALTTSCTKELDQIPSYSANAEVIYRDPALIQQALTRLYATLAVSGQQGPAGQPDISGIDEGFSNYLRQLWFAQEVTTDEAIIAWNDGNLPDYNTLTWNANNEFVRAMYDRIFYQVALCNEFIRQTSDEKLSSRGIPEASLGVIRQYRAEARFLRALSYYHALDMFGNVPFADETSEVGGSLAKQKSRADLFKYVESELKDIEGSLMDSRAVYARVDKGTCWTLQTKLYLNAEVYTSAPGVAGTSRYTDAITYADKVLKAGYTLAPEYRLLFLADNDKTQARNEIIFPVTFDGRFTKTFGGMPFIIHAAIGGSMPATDFGVNGGWGGNRAKPNLVDLFPSASDTRNTFYKAGQTKEINDIFSFTQGYAVTKFKNVTSTGVPGSDDKSFKGSGDFVDTDFPMFRLSDVQLMYAEAVLRGGTGGDPNKALQLVNAIRTRAQATPLASLTLQDILDERARELYWEGHRRTDLIRFGLYTSSTYVWPFKGSQDRKTAAGQGVAPTRVLFPIPTTDLVANPNLKQNQGY